MQPTTRETPRAQRRLEASFQRHPGGQHHVPVALLDALRVGAWSRDDDFLHIHHRNSHRLKLLEGDGAFESIMEAETSVDDLSCLNLANGADDEDVIVVLSVQLVDARSTTNNIRAVSPKDVIVAEPTRGLSGERNLLIRRANGYVRGHGASGRGYFVRNSALDAADDNYA